MVSVTLTGRATTDTEISGGALKVAKNCMAVRIVGVKLGEKDVDYYNIIAYGQKADMLETLVHKGDMFLVQGSQRIKECNGKTYVEVTVQNVELIYSKNPNLTNMHTGTEHELIRLPI